MGGRRKQKKITGYDCWSSMPPELLEKIYLGLTLNADYVRFRGVCKNWRTSSPFNPRHLPSQTPWVMLPTTYNNTTYYGDFFCLPEKKNYHIDLPEVHGKQCFGSAQGWLCLIDENNVCISLFNPLTRAEIHLPPITTVPQLKVGVSADGKKDYVWKSCARDVEVSMTANLVSRKFMMKLALSGSPSSDNYVAMVIYGDSCGLAFCRAGDSKWTAIDWGEEKFLWYYDVVYHKGKFYVAYENGRIVVYDTDRCDDPKEKEIEAPVNDTYELEKYLVEVSGELMMVIRLRIRVGNYSTGRTIRFYVYRLENEKWIKVTSLSDCTLFVGAKCSFSFPIAKYARKRYKPNSIYFLDDDADRFHRGNDLGLFNLKKNRIEPISFPNYGEKLPWRPPIWITPSLC